MRRQYEDKVVSYLRTPIGGLERGPVTPHLGHLHPPPAGGRRHPGLQHHHAGQHGGSLAEVEVEVGGLGLGLGLQ